MRPPNGYVRFRMRNRRISTAEVDEVLDAPEVTYPSRTHEDRMVILGQTLAGRRLKVVVLAADPQTVVTVADRDSEE